MNSGFSDDALLLIGHGSSVNEDSAAPTYQHAAEVRRRKIFARVAEAFWKQEPGIRKVLAGLTERRVFVVPLFLSDGYFTQEVIPLELCLRLSSDGRFDRIQQQGDRWLYYCEPVGTHESITRIILARADEVTARYPFPRAPKPTETALFVVGHGTDRNPNSRRAMERQVEVIRSMQRYGEVHALYMEEDPRVSDCYTLAHAKNFVVVPFFISDGLHSNEDIPVLLGEPEKIVRQRLQNGQPTWRNPTEKHGKRVWYSRSVGTEPHLADVILERVWQICPEQAEGDGS